MRMKLEKFYNNKYEKIDDVKVFFDYTNKRVKIIDFDNSSLHTIKKIIYFANSIDIGKVICNCNIEKMKTLMEAGFELEGKIEGYFKGQDAYCMSYFISSNRKISTNYLIEDSIIKECINRDKSSINTDNSSKFIVRNAVKSDIDEMINLFSMIFSTYPSPVYDSEFIKSTMEKNVLYKVAVLDGKIIGIASADMDEENLNAEITDCATNPEYRGLGVLSRIISSLEKDLKKNGFICLYSLSRAINPSINFAFSKYNYNFAGRLINNCNICGDFENMNIWVKNIN